MVGLALIMGFICGLVWFDLRHRQAAMDNLARSDEEHRTATKTLTELHNKSILEHAALLDRLSNLEFKITNHKTEPILRKF